MTDSIANLTHHIIKRLTDMVSQSENDLMELALKYNKLLVFVEWYAAKGCNLPCDFCSPCMAKKILKEIRYDLRN